jgi:hypothetical protein
MYRTKIVLEKFEFGAKPGGAIAGGSNENSQNSVQKPQNTSETPVNNNSINYPEEDINPEDIPF